MNKKANTPTKKSRSEAIGAMRARLDKKASESELWPIIRDYRYANPDDKDDSRSVALVSGAILEQGLDIAILSHFIAMDERQEKKLFQGPDCFLNFATKIKLAYGLGVFGLDSVDDLDIIRHVRNLFAHEKRHIKFSDEIVVSACAEIKWIRRLTWGGLLPKPITARDEYMETVLHYFSFFCGSYVGQKGRPITYMDADLKELYS